MILTLMNCSPCSEVSNAWECLCRDRSLFPSLVEYTLELTASALEDPHTVIDTGGGAASKCEYGRMGCGGRGLR